jgi:hypothetical protein
MIDASMTDTVITRRLDRLNAMAGGEEWIFTIMRASLTMPGRDVDARP